MKRKLLAVGMAAVVVLSLFGCGNKKAKDTKGELKLGEYKGLKVKQSTYEVTEQEVKEYIDALLKSKQTTEEQTEGTLEADMKVKVDYVSTIDGAEYSGGTQTGASITLTDGSFKLDDVTKALVGKKVGDVVEVDTKYPDDYSDEAVKGKAVHFTVTVKAILKTVIPEYTDAFVKDNYSYLGYENMESFNEYLKNDLRTTSVFNEIWQQVLDNAEAISYDSKELKERTDSYVEQQKYYLQMYYGYDLNEYLQAVNKTQAEFEKELEAEAKNGLKEKMVYEAIIKAENIKLTDEEYNKQLAEYAGNYGFKTVEEFSSQYSSYAKEDFEFSMLVGKAQEIIAESAKPVPDSELETTTQAAETTSGVESTGEDTTTKAAE